MTKVRDALVSFFGGSEMMWDVALGVSIAGISLLIFLFLIFWVGTFVYLAGRKG